MPLDLYSERNKENPINDDFLKKFKTGHNKGLSRRYDHPDHNAFLGDPMVLSTYFTPLDRHKIVLHNVLV